MKKKLFLFLLIFSCIVFGGVSTTISLYADENSITNLSSTVLLGTGEAQKENGIYIAEFKGQDQPYDELTYRLSISTADVAYSDLSNMEREAIAAQLVWSLNDTQLEFDQTGKALDTENVTVVLFVTKIGVDARITITKPGTYTLTTHVTDSEDVTPTQQTINAKYATPNKLKLLLDYNNEPVPATNEIAIDYDTFETGVLSAKFDLPDFVDPQLDIVYEWTINNVVNKDVKTSTYQITAFSIGKTTIACAIPSMALEAKVVFVVTSSQEVALTITPSGGELEQTLGQANSQPITFTASVPIVETYTVEWYLKTPKTATYKKMKSANKSFTFSPLEYNVAGEYKLFAQAILPTQVIESKTFTIKLNAKDIQITQLFNILCETYSNTETGLEAFKLSIELGPEFDENRIVWYIGSAETKAKAMKVGKAYDFSPEVATEYVVSVKLMSKDGTRVEQQISNTLPLTPKPVQDSNILVYCLIAVGALVILCVASILISNKGREKIW